MVLLGVIRRLRKLRRLRRLRRLRTALSKFPKLPNFPKFPKFSNRPPTTLAQHATPREIATVAMLPRNDGTPQRRPTLF